MTKKDFIQFANLIGRFEARLKLGNRQARTLLFEELVDILDKSNKNFSYSIFHRATQDAEEIYLLNAEEETEKQIRRREEEDNKRKKIAEEVLRKEAEQKNNITTSITI